MTHLEPFTCSRVITAGTERWKSSSVPSWGYVGGPGGCSRGGDILGSRGSRTHLAQPWSVSGQLGEREGRSDKVHRRGSTGAKEGMLRCRAAEVSVCAPALPWRAEPPAERSQQTSAPYLQCQGD